jgi:protein-disulfide isomerase
MQQPHDTSHATPRSSMLGSMTQKGSFFFGLLSGIALMSIIGFAVTITLVMQGSIGKTDSNGSGKVAGATDKLPTNANVEPTEPVGNPDALKPVTDEDHSQGPKNAKVTMIEFSDFQCPYCQKVHPTLKQVMKEYEGKVRWVYRHYPLESIHANARPAANASECIADLGGDEAFWGFADEAYTNQSSLGDAFYLDIAKKLGINEKKFTDCYSAKKFDSDVQTDIADASASGIQGTPGTFINGTLISGAYPYESFKAAIDAALAT